MPVPQALGPGFKATGRCLSAMYGDVLAVQVFIPGVGVACHLLRRSAQVSGPVRYLSAVHGGAPAAQVFGPGVGARQVRLQPHLLARQPLHLVGQHRQRRRLGLQRRAEGCQRLRHNLALIHSYIKVIIFLPLPTKGRYNMVFIFRTGRLLDVDPTLEILIHTYKYRNINFPIV
jgi:hypothetical protein